MLKLLPSNLPQISNKQRQSLDYIPITKGLDRSRTNEKKKDIIYLSRHFLDG